MQASYWNRFTQSRITRRRGLAAAGAGALGAAFLAACGGDDSGSGEPAAKKSDLLFEPVETTLEVPMTVIIPIPRAMLRGRPTTR